MALVLFVGTTMPSSSHEIGELQSTGVQRDRTPDLVPNLAPDLVPNLAPNLVPDLVSNLVPDLVPNLVPN